MNPGSQDIWIVTLSEKCRYHLRKIDEVSWLISALTGTALISLAGILDKFLLSDYAKDSRSYVICQIFFQQLIAISVLLLLGVDFIYPESAFALFAGGLQVVPAFYYMKALQIEDVTRVTALEYLYPVFVFIGAIVLLGETYTSGHCAGGLLLILGVILASYRQGGGALGLTSLSPAIRPFIVYWILTAIYFLALKCLLSSIDEWNLYTWSCLGNLMASLPLLLEGQVREDVASFFRKGRLAIGALMTEEVLQFSGVILSLFAFAEGSVALVTCIGALQPMITLILMLAIMPFYPGLVQEMEGCIDRKILAQKSMSFLIIIAGIYLIC